MRPETVDGAIDELFEAVFYASQVAIEARYISDDEDESGKPIDPIHAYAKSLVRDAVPLAILGIFLLIHQGAKA